MKREQKELVRLSFQALAEKSDTVAALFYTRLFEIDPALRPLFRISIPKQGQKFMEMLDAIVGSMDRLDQVVAVVWQVGKRHGGYGVQEKDYATVRTALFWAFEQYLGDRLTPETVLAWSEVYDILETTMQQAAREGSLPRPEIGPEDG